MILRTTCKAVNCFSNVARGNYSIVTSRYIYIYIYFYYVGKICTDIIPTNSCANWEDYAKAWNYITIDFHQEMGQEYSKIVQIIVKADRGKAIAWRSVSCKMTCYHIPDEKNTLSSQSAFCTHSAVSSLHFASGLHSAFCTYRYPWHQYSLFLVTVIRTTHTIYHKIPVCELIWHFRSFPR